jgi:hypothetical protein
MRLIGLAVIVTVSLILAPLAAEAQEYKAQQLTKVTRIGLLWTSSPQLSWCASCLSLLAGVLLFKILCGPPFDYR